MTVELLANVLDAHGGLDNWNRVDSLSAQFVLGGPFLSMVCWPQAELRPTATLLVASTSRSPRSGRPIGRRFLTSTRNG